MTAPSLDIVAIGNAIVDVIAQADDQFLHDEGLAKGAMQLLFSPEEAEMLYAKMGSAIEASGGSAANTIAGVAALGGKTGFIGQVANDQLGHVFAHDITWLVFATYLHARITKGWEGKKTAILGGLGFFVIWICYLGVNFLGKGLHSYGWFS